MDRLEVTPVIEVYFSLALTRSSIRPGQGNLWRLFVMSNAKILESFFVSKHSQPYRIVSSSYFNYEAIYFYYEHIDQSNFSASSDL